MFGIPDFLRDQLGSDWGNIVTQLLTAAVVATVWLLLPIFTIWLERKISARFQDRIGPNRVGQFGLLQSIADVLKLLTKEQIVPRGADLIAFMVAPILMVVSVITITAVIPLNQDYVGTDLSIAMLYVMAVGSLSTIAILVGGWASNNKYALLGSFRVIAQLVSYEIPMVLALLVPVLLAGTLRSQGIIEAQADVWFIFLAPLAALIFFIASTAEVGRQPFDLLEAESEIVAGYNIEYSGMPFAMFYLGEWLHAVIICVLTAMLFLGGWQGPLVEEAPILGVFYMIAKSLLLYFVHMWVRFTVPRLRIDHLMSFNWKFLVPLSVANLLVVASVWRIANDPNLLNLADDPLPRGLIMFGANLVLMVITLAMIRNIARQERERVEGLVDETIYDPRLNASASAGD